jgi:hypothetical protein
MNQIDTCAKQQTKCSTPAKLFSAEIRRSMPPIQSSALATEKLTLSVTSLRCDSSWMALREVGLESIL